MNRYSAIFIFTILYLAGCDSSYKYNGDGKLSDTGYHAATDRYVLNLGDINLWKNNEYHFSICNLPIKNFVFGIDSTYKNITDIDPISGVRDKVYIEIVVTDQDGFKIIKERALIKDWVWSHNREYRNVFGYRACEEKADQNGYFTCKEGTGTFFTPSKGKQYSVKLVVSGEERADAELIGTLLAKSGGLK